MNFTKFSRNQLLGAVGALVVIVVIAVVLGMGGGGGGSKSTSSTTVPTMTHTVSQQAVIASLSVARAALYNTATPKTAVSAKDVTAAALPDKGTLIVLKNLGEIPGYSNVVAFQWNFGGAPILTCVQLPKTRAGAVAKVDCPSGIHMVKVKPTVAPSTPKKGVAKSTKTPVTTAKVPVTTAKVPPTIVSKSTTTTKAKKK